MQGVVDYNKRFSESNNGFINRMQRIIEQNYILKQLSPGSNDRILEIGCNSSKFTEKLAQRCENVIGVDINKEAIEAGNSDRLLCMNAEKLDFENESFSKIVSMHTIEHIPNVKKALLEMERVVKKGGIIALSYPFEPVRGIACLGTACLVYRNPMVCRRLHLHNLNLGKMKKLIGGTKLSIVSHKLLFSLWPVYVSVLEKG